MINQKRSFPLLVMATVLVIAAAGVAISLFSSSDNERQVGTSDGFDKKSMSNAGAATEAPPSKTDRPEKDPLDDGGFTPGTPEWHNTEAGQAFLKSLKPSAIMRGPVLVDDIDPQVNQRILENLTTPREYLRALPSVGYEEKGPLPNDWKVVLEILSGTVAHAYGPNGTDPRFVHSGPTYFFLSNQHHEDFSRGYAVRKSDGALFHWNLAKTVAVEP